MRYVELRATLNMVLARLDSGELSVREWEIILVGLGQAMKSARRHYRDLLDAELRDQEKKP